MHRNKKTIAANSAISVTSRCITDGSCLPAALERDLLPADFPAAFRFLAAAELPDAVLLLREPVPLEDVLLPAAPFPEFRRAVCVLLADELFLPVVPAILIDSCL